RPPSETSPPDRLRRQSRRSNGAYPDAALTSGEEGSRRDGRRGREGSEDLSVARDERHPQIPSEPHELAVVRGASRTGRELEDLLGRDVVLAARHPALGLVGDADGVVEAERAPAHQTRQDVAELGPPE